MNVVKIVGRHGTYWVQFKDEKAAREHITTLPPDLHATATLVKALPQ